MRWTDRLRLPQKIVLIIALGLAFAAIADALPTLATTTARSGWYAYAPAYQSSLTLHAPLVSGWLELVIWLVLTALWAAVSIRILRSAPEQPGPTRD